MSDTSMNDFLDGLSNHLETFREKHGECRSAAEIVESGESIIVKNFSLRHSSGPNDGARGSWVSIRPVGDEKTYIGIFLGDMVTRPTVSHSAKSETLFVDSNRNPAIWVPDLNKVVWGYESWWGPIESEDDLRKISDQDIENVWYVKALKSLEKTED